jgi:cytochrome c-type biogenesis protein
VIVTSTLVLAFTAGVLSTLSPCVLPILPLVLGAASSVERLGPVALAAGLSLSFVAIGLFVATIGYSIGLDADVFRDVAGTLIIAIGLVLMLPDLQTRLATASGPIANWTDQRFGSYRGSGLPGQFVVGVLLGAVWSPCVGPTLGAASLLAAKGQNLLQVTTTMFVFGIGAALPLLLLGLLSREAMMRWRGRLLSAGQMTKAGLGILFVAIGALVLTGFDKSIETVLVAASPSWLTDVTTRF